MLGAAAEQLDRAAAVIAQYAAARRAGVEPTAALATASQRVTGPDASDAVEMARGAGLLPPARANDGAIAVEADDSGVLLAAELEPGRTPSGDEPLLTVAIGGGLLVEMTPSEAEGVLAERQDCSRDRVRRAQEPARAKPPAREACPDYAARWDALLLPGCWVGSGTTQPQRWRQVPPPDVARHPSMPGQRGLPPRPRRPAERLEQLADAAAAVLSHRRRAEWKRAEGFAALVRVARGGRLVH